MGTYEVTYICSDTFSGSGDWKKHLAIMTAGQLSKMLLDPMVKVWNATLVDLEEYKQHHKPETYEDMTRKGE